MLHYDFYSSNFLNPIHKNLNLVCTNAFCILLYKNADPNIMQFMQMWKYEIDGSKMHL